VVIPTWHEEGDPRENEAALREALPALYVSFRPALGKAPAP
jgi:hypothetical protein